MLLYHISYYKRKVLYLKQKYIAQMLFVFKNDRLFLTQAITLSIIVPLNKVANARFTMQNKHFSHN